MDIFMEELISAAFLSRHPSAAKYLTVELRALKELSQELAELFDLTLPVAFKKQSHTKAGDQHGLRPH